MIMHKILIIFCVYLPKKASTEVSQLTAEAFSFSQHFKQEKGLFAIFLVINKYHISDRLYVKKFHLII